ncbi:hypothetical protein ASF43_22355 [Pseudorhodoferax sp. Leaf267]|nr:hypothetical protein ASF43_22355 [Pseudorhodoferax sp. Leaf267]
MDRHPVRRITVFEASGVFGPGYPYRLDDCADYLINNTTGTMCLVPGHRRAFLDWLAGQQRAIDPRGHLPRREFGRFLADTVRAAQTSAAIKGIQVELIGAEVTGLQEPAHGGVRVQWHGGEVAADAAILTTGRCPDRQAAPRAPAGAGAVYVLAHIGGDALDDLPLDATCHVLGASLSAYDIVNRLFAPRTGCSFVRDAAGVLQYRAGPNARQVVLCSRSGRLKKMHSRTPLPIRRTRLVAPVLAGLARQGGLTLAAIQALVDEEAAAHGQAVDWPQVLAPYANCDSAEAVNRHAGALLAADIAAASGGDGANFLADLADNAQDLLWQVFAQGWLRPDQQRLYRTHVESAVLTYAATCPIPTAERLLALHRAGRLVVRTGVHGVALQPDGSAYTIAHRFGLEQARVLVNATGAVDRRVASPHQGALLASLHAQGLAQPYRLDGEVSDGVAVDLQTFRLDGSRCTYAANMLLWGPAFFTSSAFTMASVVEQLLAGLFAAHPVSPSSAPPLPRN